MSQAYVENIPQESYQNQASADLGSQTAATGESQAEANEYHNSTAAFAGSAPGAEPGLPEGHSGESQLDNSALESAADWMNHAGEGDFEAYIQALNESGGTNQESPESDAASVVAKEAVQPETTQEIGEKLPQYRLRPRSEDDQRVFDLMKDNLYLKIEDALAQVRGATQQPEPAQDQVQQQPAEETESARDIQSQIFDLRKQLLDAKRTFDVDTEVDIEEQILALEERLPQIAAAEQSRQQAEAEANRAWEAAARAAQQKTLEQFPEAGDANSAFAQRMNQIDEAWEEAGDRRFDDPNKALVIAAIVAKEFGRQPVQKAHPAPSANPGAAPKRIAPPLVPASGAARTYPASQIDTEARRIADMNDPLQWMEMAAATA